MSEQIDIAVDLGVVAPPLPEIEFLREFVGKLVQPPAQAEAAVCSNTDERG